MTDRSRQLARIHILKAELELDDDAYRNVLWSLARVESAKDLDEHGRGQVIQHLERHRRAFASVNRPRPSQDKEALVGKIRALLHAQNREERYADGIARRMFKIDRYDFCTPEQLHKIVAALSYDAQRHRKAAASL